MESVIFSLLEYEEMYQEIHLGPVKHARVLRFVTRIQLSPTT